MARIVNRYCMKCGSHFMGTERTNVCGYCFSKEADSRWLREKLAARKPKINIRRGNY